MDITLWNWYCSVCLLGISFKQVLEYLTRQSATLYFPRYTSSGFIIQRLNISTFVPLCRRSSWKLVYVPSLVRFEDSQQQLVRSTFALIANDPQKNKLHLTSSNWSIVSGKTLHWWREIRYYSSAPETVVFFMLLNTLHFVLPWRLTREPNIFILSWLSPWEKHNFLLSEYYLQKKFVFKFHLSLCF